MMPTVSVAGVVPLGVPRVSQFPPMEVEAVAVKPTGATLVSDTDTGPGVAAPIRYSKVIGEGEATMSGETTVRVTSTARAQRAVSFTAPVAEPELPVRDQQPPRSGTRPTWGNLPAPWEPLPDWLASPGDAPEAAAESLAGPAPQQPAAQTWAGPAVAPSTPGSAPSASSASSTAASASTPGVQRAERGRALPDAESEAAPAHPGAAPEPDLDALAQQVHAILKRRLAAERRRFG